MNLEPFRNNKGVSWRFASGRHNDRNTVEPRIDPKMKGPADYDPVYPSFDIPQPTVESSVFKSKVRKCTFPAEPERLKHKNYTMEVPTCELDNQAGARRVHKP